MSFTPEEQFPQAAADWDLERLYKNLAVAKREVAPHKRSGLTPVEKCHLRGLLCGYNPEEIAEKLCKTPGGVTVDLSNTLYRYTEQLTGREQNTLNNWRDIIDWLEEAGYRLPEPTQTYIDSLVQNLREKVSPLIRQRCGTMRVLDMTQPIGLGDIYTKVKILQKITGRRRLDIADLLKRFDLESQNFDHLGLCSITTERLSGIRAVKSYPKLMVLGKPGSGKTTFLKYLAIQCSLGNLLNNRVPIFMTIRDFAQATNQPTCSEFITDLLSNYGVITNQINHILTEGKALILLDGLDEVREEDAMRVITEIRNFSERYHTNQFVITCRIAANDYTFEQFTEVEVADFNNEQIKTFVTKWFDLKSNSEVRFQEATIAPTLESVSPRMTEEAERFIQQLQANPPIKELATNPLLLTLLCLEFEDSGDFPADRAELYKRGITTLLVKWDAKRGIVRDRVYSKLSVQRKQDLLSQIALTTFERKDYLFKQQLVERYIAEYICNLPDANTDPEALQLDSEAVLKSIEAQHGLLVERARSIYSFSHLTFHEYFTARKIVTSSEPQAMETSLQSLVSHITEKSWREVFLLTVGMLPSTDYLLQLMKQQIDGLVANSQTLQELLRWVREKSLSVKVPYKPAAVRAFYFELACHSYLWKSSTFYIDADLMSALDNHLFTLMMLGNSRTLDIGVDAFLSLTYERSQILHLEYTSSIYAFKGAFLLSCDRALTIDSSLGESLQHLKQQLPNLDENEWRFKEWWKFNGFRWTQQLSAVMISHRNIGHNWQFNPQEKELLRQYYDANKLLVDCLNSDCYVSREVRQEIEDTLLLPIAEINNRGR
ncbi:NACHT domain-containing protein [Limnofasciculus baicalensis]|uniref:NACHT domain-containing NTPase n=1 Tax=Limnofasciculus baicalensis BBK-W-15 TaxID=2699891 RepID=A0AAE3GS10_9CYAN|nr:NACHT domain-containing NTPase [Limnofasciculus baicalensis]MCP2727492.1 NACHT domain-containing NTPase [Limnofasciculus baicalensis BBK-W-15]